jgi:N-acetylglucosaminyldiphosphoundecaprenol N-acetyl-beta-D-mannosaminyltransferase
MLGVRITPMRLHDLLASVEQAVGSGERWIIANHNLHSLCVHQTDPKMRAFYAQARCTFVDGMGVVLLGRLLGLPLRRDQRITAVDWLRPVLRMCRDRGWRVLFLGARPGVAAKAAGVLMGDIPGLQVEVAHGYFDVTPGSSENEAVLDRITAYRPDVLIVGMGMPRQEHWIVDNLDRIPAGAIFNQGGFLDYLAGVVTTPPRWTGRVGFEWLARLLADPARLWSRYLVEPWQLAPRVLRELWEGRRR